MAVPKVLLDILIIHKSIIWQKFVMQVYAPR